MKVAIASDIHLEFGTLDIQNTENADVLILAGDICTAKDFRNRDSTNKYSVNYHDFFDRAASQFPHVLYVLGNHEHYGNDMAYTAQNLRDRLADRTNIRILEKESIVIDGVTFLGTTLWTSLNNRDPFTMWRIPNLMSDFTQIKLNVRKDLIHNDPPRLTPDVWCDEHDRCRKFLDTNIKANTDKVVVITHFTPSFKSCAPEYMNDGVMNGAYHTELHNFIWDNPQVKLWFHGHTHSDVEYEINQTKVVCNPRGYIGYENRVNTWGLKYFEV